MEIEIYVCDTSAKMAETAGGLMADHEVQVVYATDGGGESGDIVRYNVVAGPSAADILSSFAGKWIVIAVRH
jgi:hypothetical protein